MTLPSNIEQIQEKHDITTEQARFLLIAHYTTLNPEEVNISNEMENFTSDVCKWSKRKMTSVVKVLDELLDKTY